MYHRVGCSAFVVLAFSCAMCQNPTAPSQVPGTHPLSEAGDPPGLAEFLKRQPRIVERPLISGPASDGYVTGTTCIDGRNACAARGVATRSMRRWPQPWR